MTDSKLYHHVTTLSSPNVVTGWVLALGSVRMLWQAVAPLCCSCVPHQLSDQRFTAVMAHSLALTLACRVMQE